MKRNKSKDGLRKFLDDVCQLIRDLEPRSQITITPHRIYETGDAHIEVLLPYRKWTRKADKIADAVYKRLWEIEIEHGYDIGASLRTLDELKVAKQG